jgi:MFS family permease
MGAPARLLPLIVASALFMENMDATVIATSLPAIAEDLGTDPIVLKLAFTTYLLSLTVFIPISGWCADRFGAKHIFRAAIAVFMLGSIASGYSQSLGGLITARAVQGLGGAMMVPVGRLIILREVPKNQMVDALAWLTIPALVGPLVGPPIGGFITTYFDWRWVFWMNVPIGLLGLAVATRYLPEVPPEPVAPLDFRGFLLSALGLSSLVFGFTIMGRDLLPITGQIVLISFGALCLALYVRHAATAKNPIPALWLQAIAAGQWRGVVPALGLLWPALCGHTFRPDLAAAACRRFPPLPAIHRDECTYLRRHCPRRHQQCHHLLRGGPAVFAVRRGGGGGLRPGSGAGLAG